MTPTQGKRTVGLFRHLYLYPPPVTMVRTPRFWLATALVVCAAILFSVFFIVYTTSLHAAYLSHAEDLGNMDQAIWSTLQGKLLYQTICNPLSDSNCFGSSGISRFAIHFEPILLLVAQFYRIWPDPRTLLILQTVVVAIGAFPAFWLARLRLRSDLAGVGFALLYLLYPAQQEATRFDFHAVTLTASLLLFALYFLYTRKTVWVFVFAILAMACKEEIAGLVALLGLWSCIFQQRWRSGLLLTTCAFAWLGLTLLNFHIFSPTGHSLLESRYSYLGATPLAIAHTLLRNPHGSIHAFLLEKDHFLYLRLVFSPAGYLPLLAPWVSFLALPTLVLNLLSRDPSQYSGMYQYSVEIVPVLVFATIESVVLLSWLTQRIVRGLLPINHKDREQRLEQAPASRAVPSWNWSGVVRGAFLTLVVGAIVLNVVRVQYQRGTMPFSRGFTWPQTTAHALQARRLIALIPPAASVSAQSDLVPHLSHRMNIYQFPYQDTTAEYIFLDISSNTIYPYLQSPDYIHEVKTILLKGSYGVVAAQDGYLLLKRGLPPIGIAPFSPVQGSSANGLDINLIMPELPAAFCTFAQGSPRAIENPVEVTFSNGKTASPVAELVGYHVNALNPFNVGTRTMTVTTYWRVLAPTAPLQPVVLLTDQHGQEHLISADFPGAYWCPTNAWKPGALIRLQSRSFMLDQDSTPLGPVHVSLALAPLTVEAPTDVQSLHRLSLHVIQSAGKVAAMQSEDGLMVASLKLVP